MAGIAKNLLHDCYVCKTGAGQGIGGRPSWRLMVRLLGSLARNGDETHLIVSTNRFIPRLSTEKMDATLG